MPIETLTLKKFPICYTRRIKAFRRLLFPSTHAQIPVPFSGTIHFVDFSFKTPSGIVKVPTTDVTTAFNYAIKASPIISKYCTQYGTNSIKINNLLANTVTLRGSTYNDLDVQTWVNDLAVAHNLPPNDAIIILNPLGIVNTDAPISQGVGGYHNYATIPFIFVNVFGTPLTVPDQADFYAMILSHEIAEMVVDPYADLSQPEVCDSCAGNCNVDYRNYFDNNGKWLGGSPVLGYAFLTDGIVTPAEAPRCPASYSACTYDPANLGPPVPINPPLTTSFILTAGALSVGERIGFLASADGGVQPYAFAWNFGDGSVANGNIAVHAYTKAGTFKVTLTTTDSGLLIFKQTAIATQDLVVVGNPIPPPTLSVSFIASPANPKAGQQVLFTASAMGGTPPVSFSWSFGDGTTAIGSSATHAYQADGTYTVVLIAKDSGTQTTTGQVIITVSTPPPTLTPGPTNQTPDTASVGQQVTFTTSATGGTPPLVFKWNFGDGSTATGTSVTHTFANAGTFTVTLTITDSGTPQQTNTQAFLVTIAPTSVPPPPPTNPCIQFFDKADAEFAEGFNAAGFADVLNGLVCLFQNKLISRSNLRTAIKLFYTQLRLRARADGAATDELAEGVVAKFLGIEESDFELSEDE